VTQQLTETRASVAAVLPADANKKLDAAVSVKQLYITPTI